MSEKKFIQGLSIIELSNGAQYQLNDPFDVEIANCAFQQGRASVELSAETKELHKAIWKLLLKAETWVPKIITSFHKELAEFKQRIGE